MKRVLFFWVTCLLSIALICPEVWAKSNKKFVVVLDAGHGGGDIGTPHRKLKKDEKTIALDLTLRVGKAIEAKYPDVKVVYTRKKDVYPTLPERTRIAKEAQGDLFISIHVNAAPNASARGIETYVFGVTGLAGKSADEQKRIRERMANERENLDISGKQVDFDLDMDIETKILCQAQREKNNIHSEEVARYVHNSMTAAVRKTSYRSSLNDRGIKEKNIFVLCYSPMPSILVELGYMSNPAEEKFLNSEEAMTAFTNGIVNGFDMYKTSWSKRKLTDENNPVSAETTAPKTPTPVIAEPKVQPKPIEVKTEAEPTEIKKEQKTATVKEEPKKPQNNETQAATEVKDDTKKVETKKETTTTEVKPLQKQEIKSEQKQEVKTEAKVAETKLPENTIIYKIQFMAGSRLFKEGDREFKGLKNVSHYKDAGIYKYTVGESVNNSAPLNAQLKQVRQLFKDAFIIKTDINGNRIK